MEKINFSTAIKNIKKNYWLLFSTIAALCLFISPSLISFMLTVTIFLTVMVVAAFDVTKPSAMPMRTARVVSISLAVLVAYIGFNTFNTAWASFSKVAALASALRLTIPVLLFIVGMVGCIVGFYAIYILSCWIVSWLGKLLKEYIPVQQKSEIIANLRRNWYFPISAMAFFCLSATLTLEYFIALAISFVIAILIASQIGSIWTNTRNYSNALRILSITTAIGICFGGQASFYAELSVYPEVQALEAVLPIDILGVVSVLVAIIAVFFVYFFVLLFWNKVVEIIRECRVFDEIKTAEWIVYGILFAVSIIFMAISFAKTQAFYGTEHWFDVIYTSDSPYLVKCNAYLTLRHPENDLRQPLFAVFSAPFIGIPYLAARLIGATASTQAILINSAQIMMIFAANLMLTKMMKLDPLKRICFMLLTSCTYAQLLFILMMEQYIVAYFWLILCVYLIAENRQHNRVALWGAGGTLLTSMILLPFMSNKSLIKDFKNWFKDMMKFGLEFVVIMLVFCRFDIIFNLIPKISFLSVFTGKIVPFADKVYRYTEFISNCFFAPNASAQITITNYMAWRQDVPAGINFVGVSILLLAVVSAIWNCNKKSSRLAVGWVGFSIVIFLVIGWGTLEVGLILYVLYVGWAILMLLFQLIEKIESKLNIRFLIPLITGCTIVALLAINIPAIMEMVNFARTYYPV